MAQETRQSAPFNNATLARTATGTFIAFPKLTFGEPEDEVASRPSADIEYVEVTLLEPRDDDDDLGWTRRGMLHVQLGRDDFEWLSRSIKKLGAGRAISFKAELGKHEKSRR